MSKWMALAALAAAFACDRGEGPEETTGTEGAVGAEREGTERDGPERQGTQREWKAQGGPEEQSQQDRQTAQQVHQTLMDADLSDIAENIQVMASGGRVTLHGNVETPQERTEVERLTRSVPGVQEVDNQLEIGAR